MISSYGALRGTLVAVAVVVVIVVVQKRIIERGNCTVAVWFRLCIQCYYSPTTGIIRMFQMKFPARTRWGFSGAVLGFIEINNIAKASEII